jgi:hypothetical protein
MTVWYELRLRVEGKEERGEYIELRVAFRWKGAVRHFGRLARG